MLIKITGKVLFLIEEIYMMRFLPLFVLFVFLAGCGAKPAAPTLGIYTFEENNYPCAKLEFPEQIRLLDITLEEQNGDMALVYDLDMPGGYKIQVVKLYAGENGWSLDPIASLKNETQKVYEISGEENPDKSAVISVEIMDEELYLKASAAEFLQNNIALRVDVFRRIKKIGFFKTGGVEEWKNSATGNKTIANMRNIINYIYANMASAECKYKETIDMDWWNK